MDTLIVGFVAFCIGVLVGAIVLNWQINRLERKSARTEAEPHE